MPTYLVTVSTFFHEGVKYRRGDVIESNREDLENGQLQRLPEPEPEPVDAKPKRTRKVKRDGV